VKHLRKKLAEYVQMGIPQIWVVDPDPGTFERYKSGYLTPASRFEEGRIRFDMAQIEEFLHGTGS
jgi:Uma2 family endonuclease